MITSVEMRAGKIILMATLCFVFVAVNLFRLQIMQGSYYRDLSEKNRLRIITLEGPRGKILDRNGKEIASSRLSFNCTAVLQERPSRVRKSFKRLSEILGESVETLEKRYKKQKAGVFRSIVLAEDISLEQAMAIEEEMNELNGIMVETKPVRTYPLKEAAAPVTGYIGPQSAQETEELELLGYRPSDWVGRDGMEKKYEDYLRGTAGGLQLEVNHKGQYLKVLGIKDPKEGRNLSLSLDADLQMTAYKSFGGRRGAAAVMDLASGGLLVFVSSPSYDPNLFSTTSGRKKVGQYLTDAMSPMLNRAIQGQYPAGSIYKIVTALAALEPKKILLSSMFHCPGFMMIGKNRFGCWKEGGHGSQNLIEAFAHSCDCYFYRTGLAAGPDAIAKKSMEFGFGAATGIDLPSERKGLVPSRGWKQRKRSGAWFDGDTLNLSIGQGYLLVTPLQALGMITVVATGGELIRPYLAEKIDGVRVVEKRTQSIPMTPDYLAAIKKGLEAVVQSETGTGRLVRVPGVNVAGKTGTAETHKKENHAWYVGYAPSDKPKYAFAVFLEFGGHGGVEAAAVAKDILLKAKELGYL